MIQSANTANMTDANGTNVSYYATPQPDAFSSILRMYLPPILISFGFVSNFLLFVVFGRQRFKTLNITVYLRVFAISNIIELSFGTAIEWICYLAGHDGIFTLSDAVCRLYMFALNVIAHAPGWFIVSMTIDRFVFVWFPSKALEMCNFFIAKTVVVVAVVGLIAVSVHALWTFELYEGQCYMPTVNRFHYLAWPWFSDTFFVFLPIVLLVVFCTVDFIGLILRSPLFSTYLEKHATYAAISMATMFAAFDIPAAIVKIIASTVSQSWLSDVYNLQSLITAQVVCQILGSLNRFQLTIVPALWISEFRDELLLMVTGCKRPNMNRKYAENSVLDGQQMSTIEALPEEQQPCMTADV